MSIYKVSGVASSDNRKTLIKDAIRVISIDLRKDAGKSGRIILKDEHGEALVVLDVEKKEFEQASLF